MRNQSVNIINQKNMEQNDSIKDEIEDIIFNDDNISSMNNL